MVDSNVLKQLENILIGYQENQETLMSVVSFAEKTFGEGWMSELTEALASSELDPEMKKMLQDKADHAIHYYGALAAWEESTNYLEHKVPFDKATLEERLPILEYWLALFGADGANLVNQVKELITETTDSPVPAPQETVSQENEENKKDETVLPEPVPATETLNPEDILENPVETNLDNVEEVLPSSSDEETIEDVLSMLPETTVSVNETVQEEPTTEEKSLLDVAQDLLQSEEIENPVAEEEKIVSSENDVADEVVSNEEEIYKEEPKVDTDLTSQAKDLLQEATTEEVTQEATLDSGEKEATQEVIQEELSPAQEEDLTQEAVWQPEAVQSDPLLDVEAEMTPVSNVQEPIIDKKQTSLDYDVAPTSQNWDVAAFIRQRRLYEDASSWLDAWCIHMDNADKTEYPYYGFIVDLMYDLKEKIQNVLENQLLEEIIEKDIPGGRDSVVRLNEALDKAIDGLPDDFKHSTAEKIKLSAREILGEIDTSTEKENIGAAPDGFELMDDPYAVSADQIISDFEKTEQEYQNKIDNLNVIDENSLISKKDKK